tara:strand:- start:1747 stop:1938 length:192 start_codon:yes stop_codon:yes gene_type:complete
MLELPNLPTLAEKIRGNIQFRGNNIIKRSFCKHMEFLFKKEIIAKIYIKNIGNPMIIACTKIR